MRGDGERFDGFSVQEEEERGRFSRNFGGCVIPELVDRSELSAC